MKPRISTVVVRILSGVMLLMLTVSGAAKAESPKTQVAAIVPLGPPGVPASAFPIPDRPVAKIGAPDWSTEEARDRDGEAEQVMRFLGVKPGMTVADIGAGAGYYTVRLARRVGPTGRVIAQDVMPEFLDTLHRRIEKEGLRNVTFALGEPHDPRLLPNSVDLVLMVHMYHEVEQPFGLLYNLLPALRAGARVAVIDLNQPTQLHGTPHDLLLCEFHALGFHQTHWGWMRAQYEYLALFEAPTTPPPPDSIKPCTQ